MIRKIQIFTLLYLVAVIVTIIIFISLSNSKDYIDFSDLKIDDYVYLTEEKNHQIFLIKDSLYKRVMYNGWPIKSVKLSPFQNKLAFFYYPHGSQSEELGLAIYDIQNDKFKEIYRTDLPSWDVTSESHWLGNNHIFFLGHCGTACQGITLVGLKSGKIENAVLTYPSFSGQPSKTHFRDWFGKEFVVDGLVREVSSKTEDNNHYLIFNTESYNGKSLKEKKFLFKETEIVEL